MRGLMHFCQIERAARAHEAGAWPRREPVTLRFSVS